MSVAPALQVIERGRWFYNEDISAAESCRCVCPLCKKQVKDIDMKKVYNAPDIQAVDLKFENVVCSSLVESSDPGIDNLNEEDGSDYIWY